MSELKPDPKPTKLQKLKSWSPHIAREEIWLRRKKRGLRRSKSLTDEDFDELKACIELGFGFDSPEVESDPKLSETLPALGFYVAVNKSFNETVSRMSSSSSLGTALSESDFSPLASPMGSPHTVFTPGDDPKTIKTRLRQWAQAVGCSVKERQL